MARVEVKKVHDFLWEIPKSGEMNVPGRIYADEDSIRFLSPRERAGNGTRFSRCATSPASPASEGVARDGGYPSRIRISDRRESAPSIWRRGSSRSPASDSTSTAACGRWSTGDLEERKSKNARRSSPTRYSESFPPGSARRDRSSSRRRRSTRCFCAAPVRDRTGRTSRPSDLAYVEEGGWWRVPIRHA